MNYANCLIQISMDFANKIINLWTIIYDHDVDRIYMFTEFSQVLASLNASIRGYIGDDDELCDDICRKIVAVMKELQEQHVVPININQLQICVYRWELDKTSKIHQLLAKCCAEVNDDLQKEIFGLFSDII